MRLLIECQHTGFPSRFFSRWFEQPFQCFIDVYSRNKIHWLWINAESERESERSFQWVWLRISRTWFAYCSFDSVTYLGMESPFSSEIHFMNGFSGAPKTIYAIKSRFNAFNININAVWQTYWFPFNWIKRAYFPHQCGPRCIVFNTEQPYKSLSTEKQSIR